MKQFIIISDSFKGTISSKEIANIFKEECNLILPNINVVPLIIADGGEGTLDAIANSIPGEYHSMTASDPYFFDMETRYYINKDGTAAFIETASTAGLTLVGNKLNPELTTTYGIGQQIKSAINLGVKNIYIGLGGSCTNDGGCGLAAALGTKFYNNENEEFIPTGKTLNEINKIDNSATISLLEGVNIIGLTDVKNPLYGIEGAAYVYARQKGADDEMIKRLDENLFKLNTIIKNDLNLDPNLISGSGAAGGLGAGIIAFLNGKLVSGIDALLDLTNFDKLLKQTDMVFTGEGRFDDQSLNGKVISGISKRCKKANVPLIVVAGSATIESDEYVTEENNINAVFTTYRYNVTREERAVVSKDFYRSTIKNVLKLIRTIKK